MLNIDEIITTALKQGDTVALNTARLLKAEILKYKTAKNAKPYTEVTEMQIISKMARQREEAILHYKQGGREDLVEKEVAEFNWLSSMLPKMVSEEELKAFIEYWYPNGIEKKDMGKVIKELKEKYPTTGGEKISKVVKEYLV